LLVFFCAEPPKQRRKKEQFYLAQNLQSKQQRSELVLMKLRHDTRPKDKEE
jgi:hypothetical protein